MVIWLRLYLSRKKSTVFSLLKSNVINEVSQGENNLLGISYSIPMTKVF